MLAKLCSIEVLACIRMCVCVCVCTSISCLPNAVALMFLRMYVCARVYFNIMPAQRCSTEVLTHAFIVPTREYSLRTQSHKTA